MMMRKILVAVDGTTVAREAARVGLELAERLSARVTLLHVLPPSLAEEGSAPEFAAFEQACEQYARELLEEVLLLTGRPGPRIDTVVLHGEPASAIIQEAEAKDFDLVVLGTRARGALARTLLGSVADEVIRHCHRPVLVVPESAQRVYTQAEGGAESASEPSLTLRQA